MSYSSLDCVALWPVFTLLERWIWHSTFYTYFV